VILYLSVRNISDQLAELVGVVGALLTSRVPRMAKKLKLPESRVVIPSRRTLAARRRLRFFWRSVVPIVRHLAHGFQVFVECGMTVDAIDRDEHRSDAIACRQRRL